VAARAAEQSGPPPLGIHILLKRDAPQKLANLMSHLESGTLAPIELIRRAR
jgi:hypothetical protein